MQVTFQESRENLDEQSAWKYAKTSNISTTNYDIKSHGVLIFLGNSSYFLLLDILDIWEALQNMKTLLKKSCHSKILLK